ncbi:MAG: tyrosine-protein phosphatase [Prevotellaceae bacterium]|jgi:protein tyrosine/serine phosphatase|nr:tyrosine-protein phosphatase [Prevotellaceae bacterium]
MDRYVQSKKTGWLIFCLLIYSPALFSQTAVKIDRLGLTNLYRIDEGLFRSEQPDKLDFMNFGKLGITEVLNLRLWHSDKDEAKNMNLTLHRVPMRAGNIKDSDVVQALKIIRDRKGGMLIHCRHGSDRTGVIVAMYRVVFQNYTKEQAIEEMTNGGFGFHTIYSNIIEYIRRADIEKIKNQMTAE